ncbi:MAG: N-acetylglucosamine-6-phosphate deacetylase [Ruminococcaceae bacterium]|nr:N-acetylglucosamine-6-phosphate deacetylase [Oscillospiraceae bacterium]
MMKYRLCGGNLIKENGIEKSDLLISDGKIEAVISPDTLTTDEYIKTDCNGYYISAGFIDIHQHGGGGNDYMDDDKDAYFNICSAHLAHGTTSVMPTFLSADKSSILSAIERYKDAKNDPGISTTLLGIHIEGPYISSKQAGAQKPEHIRIFDEDEYREIYSASEGHIKRWSVAPEIEGAEKFADFANENGITLSIAHSDADLYTVESSYKLGFRHITHLYSCMSTIIRRGGFRVPGVLEASYYIDDMNVEIIADGCHIPPSLLSYAVKFKDNDRIALITDSMRAAGQNVEKSYLGSMHDPLPVIIEDGVAKLEDRSAFAGSIATADRLIRNMIKIGVPLHSAVKMMTVNPIRMMELNVKKGKLLEGYDADICIFDDDINIKKVFCQGKLEIENE